MLQIVFDRYSHYSRSVDSHEGSGPEFPNRAVRIHIFEALDLAPESRRRAREIPIRHAALAHELSDLYRAGKVGPEALFGHGGYADLAANRHAGPRDGSTRRRLAAAL